MIEYIIGVDGGGTKTEVVAYTIEGEKIAKCISGFGNMVIDQEKALANISYAIDSCIRSIKGGVLKAIYLGLAGIEVGSNKDVARNHFNKRYNTMIHLYNDAELARIALLKGQDGILTIGGTGSISIGVNKGKKLITGGWGHLLGDEGSGYYIAIEALKVIAHEEDYCLPRSKMSTYIMEELEINDAKQIKDIIYSSTKDQIASLTPMVVKAANNGDSMAIDILKDSGRSLAILTHSVHSRLGLSSDAPIAISGSVLTKIDIVREQFIKYLNSTLSNVDIVDSAISATKGSYYAYRNQINLEVK